VNRAFSRAGRTLLQLVAAGGLTALVNVLVVGLSPQAAALVLGGVTLAVTFAQNLLEGLGAVPTVLESAHATAPPRSANERWITGRLSTDVHGPKA